MIELERYPRIKITRKTGSERLHNNGIDAKMNRIHSASEIGAIQLYLGWVKGDPKYLEN